MFYRSVECFGNESYIADCKSVPLAPNYNLYPRAAVGLLCRDSTFNIMVWFYNVIILCQIAVKDLYD